MPAALLARLRGWRSERRLLAQGKLRSKATSKERQSIIDCKRKPLVSLEPFMLRRWQPLAAATGFESISSILPRALSDTSSRIRILDCGARLTSDVTGVNVHCNVNPAASWMATKRLREALLHSSPAATA